MEAYWALYYRPEGYLGLETYGDAFAVCELFKGHHGQSPDAFNYIINDKRSDGYILGYNYKEISKSEFDTFLAFECGPEAFLMDEPVNQIGESVNAPMLYIPK